MEASNDVAVFLVRLLILTSQVWCVVRFGAPSLAKYSRNVAILYPLVRRVCQCGFSWRESGASEMSGVSGQP
jgi:hypothetical protein